MRILIIGSQGFIGQYLISELSKHNECFGADIVNTVNLQNYYFLDKNNPNYFELFSKNEFDVCINASGSANVGYSIKEPLIDCELNFYNVEKMLLAISRTQKSCTYILLSSAAVYGNPKQLPIKEDSKLNSVSPYGFHKSCAEEACIMYSNIYGLKTFVLRLFSVYGIGQKKLLLWDLVNKFVKNDVVQLFGTGKESRDFINVLDVVNIIEILINQSNLKSCILNVANGEQVEIQTVAEIVKKSLGLEKDILFTGETREGDPLNWEADITKLKNLGYTKQISIGQGIEEYVNWAKSEIEVN